MKTKPISDITRMRMKFQNIEASYLTKIDKGVPINREHLVAHMAVLDCLEILDEAVDKLGVVYG